MIEPLLRAKVSAEEKAGELLASQSVNTSQ